MRIRRTALSLVLVAVAAAGCGGDDDSGSLSVDDPIGAPSGYEAPAPPSEVGPTVAKSGSIEVEVPRPGIGAAAQGVVDIATAPRIGGFLVSSLVDTRDGFASGHVLVKVPDARFEEVVGQLDRVGDVTRQALEGREVNPAPVTVERRRAGSAAAGVSYSPIDVSITAAAPAPPPDKPAFEQALETAKTISLGIVSGLLVGASVALPIGVVLLAVYLVAMRITRRFKPGLGA